eukprot:1144025-Pelagomonas_calceolata.AAC.2
MQEATYELLWFFMNLESFSSLEKCRWPVIVAIHGEFTINAQALGACSSAPIWLIIGAGFQSSQAQSSASTHLITDAGFDFGQAASLRQRDARVLLSRVKCSPASRSSMVTPKNSQCGRQPIPAVCCLFH